MPYCKFCSAPLPAYSSRCEYCGAKNDVDLRGIHDYSVAQQDSQRLCPICNISMKTICLKEIEKFEVERCPTCMGLFFDPEELNTLLDSSVNQVYNINLKKIWEMNQVPQKSPERTSMYIKCPVCRQLMNRVNFGARSGVIIDKCKDGIWLDNGELRKLLEWRKAGGQLYHEKVTTERIKQEEKIRKKKAAAAHRDDYNIYSSYSSTHYSRDRGEIELDALFGSVAKAVWRLFS